MFDRARHGGGGGARIENDDVTRMNEAGRGRGDLEFFAPVQLFFFVKSGIAQRGSVDRQRAAVSALHAAHLVERFQIFSNGDQGSGETAREFFDDNAAIALRQFEDFSPPLFRKHRYRPGSEFLLFVTILNSRVIAWHKWKAGARIYA